MDNDILFDKLADTAHVVEGSNRQEITLTKEILEDIKKLDAKVNQLLEELVFDSELFTIDDYYIKIIEEFLEFFSNGLSTISRDDEGIYWLEEIQDTISLVIMPRLVEDVLKKEVFTQKIPFVFSSATLSHQGDFSYIAKSLGIENVDSFSVASPFDYERQMQIFGSVNRDDKWDK
ncbi:ATP-dependent DNA helicase, partial [Pseudoalteromonas sp. 2103]|nr:ATP-dependent DNA helicase [Pseudoalteromonas sp. 2103]